MVNDLALQRNKYRHLSDEEWRWFLQQEEGRSRTADKLPSFAAIEDWWYPVRLSCEQCSSEATARYKAAVLSSLTEEKGKKERFLDLTGGYGVDTFFLSEAFARTDYVEQNAELCRIAAHNFALANKNITVYNSSAEDFLSGHQSPIPRPPYSLIFLDPARRDSHGGKVFRLEDCTPNVVSLLPSLLKHLEPDGRILLKLSPMLDITQALKALRIPSDLPSKEEMTWDVHIVAVKNEVKEILLLSNSQCTIHNSQCTITCIDLSRPELVFTFTREEEKEALCPPFEGELEEGCYLYEPSAAILKAGAYRLVAARFGLQKPDPNTHIYRSDRLIADFPGRVWRIVRPLNGKDAQSVKGMTANILTRNYPLSPDQLKKKLHLRDGGTVFVIGCRVAGRPSLFLADRL